MWVQMYGFVRQNGVSLCKKNAKKLSIKVTFIPPLAEIWLCALLFFLNVAIFFLLVFYEIIRIS